MRQVRITFNEHRDEIVLFYEFLEELISHDARLMLDPPTNNIKTIKVATTAIAKASFLLMLYNCIESTVVNCFDAILRSLESEGCKYKDLIDDVQKSALSAYDYNIRECETKEKRNDLLKQQIDFITGISVVKISLKSFVGSSSQGLFSGSLDAKEIRKHFNRIGIDLTSLKCDEMMKVKECRNKLAHGEQTFQDCGRDLTIQYLHVCKDKTLDYLDKLITLVTDYLDNKKYKRKCINYLIES